MSAFEKWFQINFENDPEAGAKYLFQCCQLGGRDSIAWDYLQRTGDASYVAETFLKAAKLILEENENH